MIKGLTKSFLRNSLACVCLASLIQIAAVPGAAAGVKKTVEQKKEIPVEKQTVIHINNANGDTKILGKKGQAGVIKITAVKKVKASDEEEALELLDNLYFEVKKTKDKVSIVTHYPKKRGKDRGFLSILKNIKRRARINYFLEVPMGLNADVSSASGDIAVLNIMGDAAVRSASGDVEMKTVGGEVSIGLSSGDVVIERIDGDVNISTSSGDAIVENVGGDLSVSATSGDIRIRNVEGNAALNIVSGDLELEGCGGNVSAGSSSGDMILRNIEGRVGANSSSGDIESTILPLDANKFNFSTASGDVEIGYMTPRGFGFLLDASTVSGSINGNMTIKIEKIARRHLRGKVGSANASLVISTASGDISIYKEP